MTSTPAYSARYKNFSINSLVAQLNEQSFLNEKEKIKIVKKDRKAHQSCSDMTQRDKFKQHVDFNNKTKSGTFFQTNPKSVPYMFIPKYKHQTFILPDRAFQKGKNAKRMFIKMKDTSVYSFKEAQSLQISKHLHKDQKQKTIISRQLEQLENILDKNDGKIKAKNNRWFLQNRKIFHPPSPSKNFFTQVDPMMFPKDSQSVQIKKISLNRTFDHRNQWRPSSNSNTRLFLSTGNSFHKQASKSGFKSTFR